MAHATKGLFCLMLGKSEMNETAQQAHQAALACAREGNPTAREMGYVRGLGAWLDGRPSETVREMEAVLARWPEDALAMKISHATRFILGDRHGMRASVEALLPAYDAQNPARGYLFGCHAFCLEETGDYARAETAGRMGLSLSPDDAWGLHAVAHVFDMTCNARAGLDWLEGREGAWAHCNNFRYHVWWHKALMHLDQGETDAVFALYDHEIRQDKTDDFRDISNGTSLLMRLELEGTTWATAGRNWPISRAAHRGCLPDLRRSALHAGAGRRTHRETAIKRMMTRLAPRRQKDQCRSADGAHGQSRAVGCDGA